MCISSGWKITEDFKEKYWEEILGGGGGGKGGRCGRRWLGQFMCIREGNYLEREEWLVRDSLLDSRGQRKGGK